jgi:luciferase family oxidoreductase group 1
VAEQFGMLEAFYPGRIDLGIGRAPGTDPVTAQALRRSPGALAGADFPRQLEDLTRYFTGPDDDRPAAPIHAVPAAGNRPAVWLLGSSGSSAQLAGQLGLPFAFAHHFSPDNTLPALELYRRTFRPSEFLDKPYAIVAAMVIAADTDERAQWLSSSLAIMVLRMTGGLPQGPHIPPEEASTYPYSDAERAFVGQQLGKRAIGGPDTVRAQVGDLLASTEADELMVVTLIHDQAERVRSYELLAKVLA